MKRILFGCVLMVMCSQAYAGEVVPVVVYETLVYDGGGILPSIRQAMTELHVPYDLRGPGIPVTPADLGSHKLLVVGWNWAGDMSGLPASVLEGGITGKKVITGHDADYHFIYGYGSTGHLGDPASVAARQFLMQAMAFAWGGGGGGGGCGLVALGDLSTGFSYLPTSWGVVAPVGNWDTVSAFTPEGQASGVYAGLTPAAMSDWANCYHDRFTQMGPDFVPFEVHGDTALTIATPEPATLCLMGAGLAGLVIRRGRRGF